jgi:hypothetical protein
MEFSFLYIATNSSMPGLLKIGCTKRSPGERIEELDSTGVPTPFTVSFAACVDDARYFEKTVHLRLDQFRVRAGREFFKLNVIEAIDHVLEIAKENQIKIYFYKTNDEHEISTDSDQDIDDSDIDNSIVFNSEAEKPTSGNNNRFFSFENKELSDIEFAVLINNFINSLEDLDPQKIFINWKEIIASIFNENTGGRSMEGFNLDEVHRHAYDRFQTKLNLIGDIGVDKFCLPHIPELVNFFYYISHFENYKHEELEEYRQDAGLDLLDIFKQIVFFLHAKESALEFANLALKLSRSDHDDVIVGMMFLLIDRNEIALKVFQHNWQNINNSFLVQINENERFFFYKFWRREKIFLFASEALFRAHDLKSIKLIPEGYILLVKRMALLIALFDEESQKKCSEGTVNWFKDSTKEIRKLTQSYGTISNREFLAKAHDVFQSYMNTFSSPFENDFLR